MATLAIAGCSKDDNDIASADTATNKQLEKPKVGTQLPDTVTNGAAPRQGKVIKAMHAGGYTYMQIENDGKQFWIAATMLNVQRNDKVSWSDAAVMKNFTSSSLRKTFDKILFVTAAVVEK